jgi:hypothetical protein
MVNILNVNPDIYINCNYQPFLFNFIKNKKLKIGDIVGVIKNHLQKSFIIGPGHIRIANKLLNHKFVITPEVIEYIKNPVIHFKPISYLIHHLEFNATHFCLRKVLDFNKYDHIKVIYKYSSVRKLTFINDDNISIDYKITSIVKKDNLLILILDNLNKNYTTIEKIIKVPKDKLDEFIKTKLKSLILYWKLDFYTQIQKDTNYEIKIKMSLPIDDIDIFNRKFI